LLKAVLLFIIHNSIVVQWNDWSNDNMLCVKVADDGNMPMVTNLVVVMTNDCEKPVTNDLMKETYCVCVLYLVLMCGNDDDQYWPQ